MLAQAAARTPWMALSPVQQLVERSCEPHQSTPDPALHLELAEHINRKKANTPREAAMECVRMINNRNPHVAMLALHLLDTLVKQCGYPFHLQIATKEFLNELVRRFPERPPMLMGPVMSKTLELIHEWKNTICVTSKHREDLVHIRDMHRLLSYKGYRFKSFDATRAMAAANPTENLKSPEELEEEDRAAKSAKLQELIRRGTPKDLAQAQELMKDLSGAMPDKQTDYTSQTKAELEKVQQKAILLNDMLNNVTEGERVGIEGDAYEQVANVCKMARPKIQKWINEESEGEGSDLMDRLLMINDLLNNVIERYEACRRGDTGRAQEIANSLNPSKPDLISFDAFADDEHLGGVSLGNDASGSGSAKGATPSEGTSTPSGLPLDLFSSPSPAPSSPFGAAFGTQASSSSSRPKQQDPMAFFAASQPSLVQPQVHNSLVGGSASANFAGLASLGTVPAPLQQQQQQQHPSNGNASQPQNTNAANNKARDPFADLASW